MKIKTIQWLPSELTVSQADRITGLQDEGKSGVRASTDAEGARTNL